MKLKKILARIKFKNLYHRYNKLIIKRDRFIWTVIAEFLIAGLNIFAAIRSYNCERYMNAMLSSFIGGFVLFVGIDILLRRKTIRVAKIYYDAALRQAVKLHEELSKIRFDSFLDNITNGGNS